MPANLPPQYKKAEESYRQAKTVSEKVAALEEMLALIPKHKGTEHVQGDLKSRLAKLRAAGEQKKGKSGPDPFHVPKHGAGQIAVVGTPNAGKSALIAAATGAPVKVADYPFSTHTPTPAMMPFEDIQIQLLDLPPVTADGMVTGMMGTLRNADAIVVCLDLAADDLLEQAEICFETMAMRGLVPEGPDVPEGGEAKSMLVVGTKIDVEGAQENLDVFLELRPDLSGLLATSAREKTGLAEFAERCFEMLDVVRIYSKEPGKDPDFEAPFTLARGSVVLDMARAVHGEIAQSLKYARIWGSGKFDGQPVQQDHILVDKDIIELHT